MIEIDEAYVDAAAPNAEAAKNGRGLVLKGKFAALAISPDETILFGECQGSGKEPYRCSCDFQRPEQPTYRCSCPSRQFPCKHCVGLLHAYALKKAFKPTEVPAELQAKREKVQERAEKKAAAPEKPKQVNLGALAKKVQAQLDGMDVLERLVCDLARTGVGNMNAKLAKGIEEQAKALGNAYLPGAQAALHRYTTLFAEDDAKQPHAVRERRFSEALDQLCRLNALVKQGRLYLKSRLDDPALKPETDTAIAAWLGHAWQLAELKEAGLVESNVELVQLAFNSHDDVARKEHIDTGVWMTLGDGRIRVTQNYRPYHAAKHIKSEDSFFQVAKVPELCAYPGNANPRIRWDGMVPRPLTADDLAAVRRFGQGDFAAAVKDVRNLLKGPLADRQPIHALNFQRLARAGEQLVAVDAKGNRLALTDEGMAEEPPSCHLFAALPPALFADQTLIVRFRHDLLTRRLLIKPLSIVTKSAIVRLTL